jgi:hypothetical protein
VGLLDRLLGRRRDDRDSAGWPAGRPAPRYAGGRAAPSASGQDPDQAAIERYRYMLRTAPPEAIEQAHAEAFARLTPAQRHQVLSEVGAAVPPAERATSDDPASLARMATRAEMRQPGTMERALGRPGGMGGGMGGMGGGIGLGGMIAGGLLASVAGAFVGTAIAEQFFDDDSGGGDAEAEPEAAADTGGGDEFGGDYGGDMGGDMGGDFGGGDFGGF